MSRYGSSAIIRRVLPDRVIAAFPDEPASMPAQVRKQVATFHEAALAVTVIRVVAVSKR
jgi:hypothetical protein